MGKASIPTANPPYTGQIVVLRGERVILDSDLAELYGVPTKQLNQQVRRNPDRFPKDFAFELSSTEWASLRSQIATLKTGRGQHRKFLPTAFTEHGALMAASVLNSPQAIEISIYLVRAFIAMRRGVEANKELAARLTDLERNVEKRLDGHDHAIAEIFAAIRALMTPPAPNRRPIGFVAPKED